MKKIYAAALTAATLVLSACSGGETGTGADTITTTVTESASPAGGGAIEATRYLESKKISIDPDLFNRISDILCDSYSNGSSGSSMTNVVSETIGTGRMDSAEVAAASAVYMCPDHIGKLPR